MLDRLFLDHWWTAALAFLLLYCADYAFTIVGARLCRETGITRSESYELTPLFQRDVARLRWISPRFLLFAVGAAAFIVAIWFVMRSDEDPFFTHVFRFLVGALLFAEVELIVRHLVNLAYYSSARREGAVTGSVDLSMWILHRVAATEHAGYGGLFLLAFCVNGSAYFLGGAFKCLVESLKQWRLSRRNPPHPAAAGSLSAREVPPRTG